jgi:hypothetical protein
MSPFPTQSTPIPNAPPVSAPPNAPPPFLLESVSLYLEQFALLELIHVLFVEKRTHGAANALKAALDKAAPNEGSPEHAHELNRLRAGLLACLFAEAFGVKR